MFLLSLLVDLPEERWATHPDFICGPIVRASLIVIYGLLLSLLFKDQDFINNFYSHDPSVVRKVKFKIYLYHLIKLVFIMYALTHETLDPTIDMRYPKED